jgi:hypothetical protein
VFVYGSLRYYYAQTKSDLIMVSTEVEELIEFSLAYIADFLVGPLELARRSKPQHGSCALLETYSLAGPKNL